MAFADLVIPRRKLTIADTEVALRGVSAADIEILMQEFAVDIIAAYGRVTALKATGGQISQDEVFTILQDLIRSTPLLAASLIAVCADEVDQTDTIMKLPIPIQVECLLAVWEMTFVSEVELKKFLAQINEFLATLMSAMGTTQPTPRKVTGKRSPAGG